MRSPRNKLDEEIAMQTQSCRKTKVSTHISFASAKTLHHACRFARPQGGHQSRHGCPPANVSAPVSLNLFVTIQWNLTNSKQDNFAALRNQRFCRWLRTRCDQLGISVAPYYVYAREKNHVHWLVHIPEELIDEFTDLVSRWVTSLEQKGNAQRKRAQNHDPAPKGTVKIERVGNSVAVRKYLLEGMRPADAFRLGIKKISPQGEIVGRRTGVSRTLGPAARKAAGYKAQRPVWSRNNGRILSADSVGLP
tara:strand:+ start:22212 stop:22961 length:750 start_codon:yes stop_codon:yes gene_type:complete